MSSQAGAHELYDAVAAPVIVWVEDALTEAYLNRLWEDNEIRILVAGCGPTVGAATTDAHKAGAKFVFGVRDRDFGKTNFTSWPNDSKQIRVFRPPRHEIENYLLDWEALAGCSENRRGRQAHDIEADVRKHAVSLNWWLATVRTLFDLSTELTRKFPGSPGQTKINTYQEAVVYILNQGNWHSHVCKLPETSLKNDKIESLLKSHKKQIDKASNGEEWIKTFPGKELLGKASAFIRTRPKNVKKPTHDIDLAKAIAGWQVTNNQRPSDLMTLRQCLRQRAGLPQAAI
ncbi:hypothetical protein J7M28_05935 [bacterium]|nr:hypothetical protein [bacterium]